MPHPEFIAPTVFIEDSRRSAVLDAMTGPVRTKQDHDMRNFLYLVTSFAQLIHDGLSGPVTPPQKEFLGHILDCAAKAQALLVPPLSTTSRVQ